MINTRMMAFFIIFIVTLGVIGFTSPDIIKNIRLGLDLRGGFEILYKAEPLDAGQTLTKEVLRQAAHSIEKRANNSGAVEPEVAPEGNDRIRVRIPGVTDIEEVRKTLKKPQALTFRSANGTKVELNGNDFVEGGAKAEIDPTTKVVHIAIKLKDKEKFTEITTRLSKLAYPENILAIYLDEEMLSDPKVDNPIPSDSAIITGNYTYEEAKEKAAIINLGALPVNLSELYTQSVGASLGLMSLEQTVRATVIACIIILLFMIIYYRVPGIVACITIAAYIWLLLLVFNLINATLTLPGIAAFVLGIGMALDANIITFERLKEEIRSGKSLFSSLKAGSKNSFRTIFDANITAIIAGVVLYYIGTGAIQGFALTLILSILVSFLTNVYFSQLLMTLLVRSNIFKKTSYYGVKEADISEL
ncbi:MAG TPA: protein translocase subunit SecD [Bacilli bacterium]